jgi:cytochrome c oxidase cbb3-type subunit 1
MSAASPLPTPAPAADAPPAAADIDASCRWPVMLMFISGALWLVAGTVLSFIVSMKLHAPGFLGDCPWLTLGRVRPAAMNSFLYGFASQFGMGVMLWMLCRLGRTRLMFQWPVLVAWKLWNIGVTIGVIAILAGAGTGFEWLEMPRAAAGILFVACAMIGLCAVATFTMRHDRELYPSQWYLLGALFWFPWIYSAANHLLLIDPVRGTLQAVVNGWFTGNFVGLWLGPLALAVIYYFLPKLTGQPLHSRELAAFAFWTMAFLTSWTGLTGLIGGPVPRWIPAVSTAASGCLIFPLICHAMNWHLTNAGNCDAWRSNSTLRFILLAGVCYLVHGLVSVTMALPQVAAVTNFTYAVPARNYLAILGFAGFAMFGAVYYIAPRLAQVEWPRPGWIAVHLACNAIGVGLLVVALGFGGVLQGARLANSNVPFIEVVRGTVPFVGMSTLAWLILLGGQVVFLVNFAGLLRGFCQPLVTLACDLCGCCQVNPSSAKAVVKA